MKKRPHVVVFFGGESAARDLSVETGNWVCRYLPRHTFDVTPIHITEQGQWQVPLGSLPREGPVDRMMEMLFSSLRAVSPVEGLQRLLRRPVDAFFNVIRGKGGDDGSLQALGDTLAIPTAGSTASTCQQTCQKHMCSEQVDDIAATPFSLHFGRHTPAEEIADDIRAALVPPLFIKPVNQEGSAGIENVTNLDELAPAITRALSQGDIVAQEQARGAEINVTILEPTPGVLHILPPTVIVPRKALYYDELAKRRPGRVLMHTPNSTPSPLWADVETIAHDVYQKLNCRGYASLDFVADDTSIDLLEVNTIPTLTEATPLRQQLKAAHLHPASVFESLVRQVL